MTILLNFSEKLTHTKALILYLHLSPVILDISSRSSLSVVNLTVVVRCYAFYAYINID